MAYCPNCGAPLTGKENFCPSCGAKLKAEITQSSIPLPIDQEVPTPYPIPTLQKPAFNLNLEGLSPYYQEEFLWNSELRTSELTLEL